MKFSSLPLFAKNNSPPHHFVAINLTSNAARHLLTIQFVFFKLIINQKMLTAVITEVWNKKYILASNSYWWFHESVCAYNYYKKLGKKNQHYCMFLISETLLIKLKTIVSLFGISRKKENSF
jgi:hypothetical protein